MFRYFCQLNSIYKIYSFLSIFYLYSLSAKKEPFAFLLKKNCSQFWFIGKVINKFCTVLNNFYVMPCQLKFHPIQIGFTIYGNENRHIFIGCLIKMHRSPFKLIVSKSLRRTYLINCCYRMFDNWMCPIKTIVFLPLKSYISLWICPYFVGFDFRHSGAVPILINFINKKERWNFSE